jgi:hypothetical protein
MTSDAAPSGNPYPPPKAPVADLAPNIPGAVLRKIRLGWMAALISAAFILFFVLVSIFGPNVFDYSFIDLLDVGLMFGLAYGIYRKSRICAVVTLLYLVYSKVFLIMAGARPASAITGGIIFGYFYVQAIAGTFAYHKLLKQDQTVRGHG